MKQIYLFFAAQLVLCITINAQVMPRMMQYPITNQPGAILAQVFDTLVAHANGADIAEGRDNETYFNRNLQAKYIQQP